MRRKGISSFGLYESSMWGNERQTKAGNPDESERKKEIRIVREALGNWSANPLLITAETLIPNELTPEYGEQMQERERYGGKRLSGNLRPQYGMLRRSRIRKVPTDVWLGDEEADADLWELVNMFGRNQIGCKDSQRVCDQVKEFARG